MPQPAADQAKLKKWLGYLDEETKLLREIGKALERQESEGAHLRCCSNKTARANNQVLGFEFKYCQIESSRFS